MNSSPRQKKFTCTHKPSTYTHAQHSYPHTQHLYTHTHMFATNTTLGQKNSYNEGYNEGVDDVFIAFSEMLDTIKDDNTYQLVHRLYSKLSDKFPRNDYTFEE